jgi:hypothetical protein
MQGLISNTGVPSNMSMPHTINLLSVTSRTFNMDSPMGFGRRGDPMLNIPLGSFRSAGPCSSKSIEKENFSGTGYSGSLQSIAIAMVGGGTVALPRHKTAARTVAGIGSRNLKFSGFYCGSQNHFAPAVWVVIALLPFISGSFFT